MRVISQNLLPDSTLVEKVFISFGCQKCNISMFVETSWCLSLLAILPAITCHFTDFKGYLGVYGGHLFTDKNKKCLIYKRCVIYLMYRS